MVRPSGAPYTVTIRHPVGVTSLAGPKSEEHALISSVINMALAILETPQGREVLVALALKVDKEQKDGKYQLRSSTDLARSHVEAYLRTLRASFPPVMIDHTMSDLGTLAFTLKFEWDRALRNFDPKRAIIAINGSRFDDMVRSSRDNPLRFRNFQFLFATALVREAGGHLFTVSLTHGRIITPRGIAMPGQGQFESGRWLAQKLFGGTTECYRDLNQDSGQSGIPHQIDEHGTGWQIDTATIIRAGRYQFDLPFRRAGGPVDLLTLTGMGRRPSP